MSSYTINEPHPTVRLNTYTHAGRGGAGNHFRAPATTPSSGVPTPATVVPSSGRFYSGRGGAGNAHAAIAKPVISFDEEYSLAEAREQASTTGHVGRGGAGNVFSGSNSSSIKKERKQSTSSDSSNSSTRSGFWGRLNMSSR